MIKRAKPPEQPQKSLYEDSSNHSFAPRSVHRSAQQRLMECTGTRDLQKIDDYACTALLALSCLSGSPSLLRRFGPMANLQVSACTALRPSKISPRSREWRKEAPMKDK
jgi:hypothetical protein